MEHWHGVSANQHTDSCTIGQISGYDRKNPRIEITWNTL
jgi:hypothetical protein